MTNLGKLITLTLVILTSIHVVSAQSDSTRVVADRYLGFTLSQNYDALRYVYDSRASFFDPTGDVFRGMVSEGVIVGAEKIMAMQKSWDLAETKFDERASFNVGEYALYRGLLNVRYKNSPRWSAVPWVIVLRVIEDEVTERLDFGEYIESFGLGDGFDTNTAATREIAGLYLKAYLDGDIDEQAKYMAPAIQFQDPTSQVFGPPSGELYKGAEALLARRRDLFGNISGFNLNVEESFVANHHAVYMGTATYRTKGGQKFAQPAVFVIEVTKGKVTRHWDFVDYSVGPISN